MNTFRNSKGTFNELGSPNKRADLDLNESWRMQWITPREGVFIELVCHSDSICFDGNLLFLRAVSFEQVTSLIIGLDSSIRDIQINHDMTARAARPQNYGHSYKPKDWNPCASGLGTPLTIWKHHDE